MYARWGWGQGKSKAIVTLESCKFAWRRERFFSQTFILCDYCKKKKSSLCRSLNSFKNMLLKSHSLPGLLAVPSFCCVADYSEPLLNSRCPSSYRQGSDFTQDGPFPTPGINPDKSNPLLVVLFSLPGGLFPTRCDSFEADD